MVGVAVAVVQRRAGCGMLGRLDHPALEEARRPRAVMRLQQDVCISELAGHPEQVRGNFVATVDPAARCVEDPQVGDRRREFCRAGKPAAQRRRALDDLADLGGRPALGRHQRRCELRQDCELRAPPFGTFRLGLDQFEGAAEMSDRFAVRGAAHRLLAGLAPVERRALGLPGLGEMVSEDFRLALDPVRRATLHRRGDAAMQGLPRAAQAACHRQCPAPARA